MKKEEELKISQLALKKKEEQLVINEKDFTRKVSGFNGDQQKVLGCIDASDKKQSKRVEHMVEVISGMKPVSAAQVLSVQDADISVKILGLLEPKKVSKIFNLMDKEISARLQKQYMTMKK
ncbi:MAG: hypothetical protein HN509_18255 [Halobacteriovoraceae bacterium]|nr:hypothetical protein [Halobacteriovoraceae bacterium]